MKYSITRLSIVVIIIIISVSCKKGGSSADSNTTFLTQQEWQISKNEQKINSDPYVDIFPSEPSCRQDDKYIFKSDNTYEINEGATKCNSTDPQVIATGAWQFAQNETHITLDAIDYTIEKLDNTTFIISSSFYSNPDTNYYRVTFVH